MVASNNAINNTVGSTISGVTNTLTVTNGSNTASSAAQALITVGGTTSASPWVQWTIGTTESWALGQNNSDSQKLYLNYNNSASVSPTTGTTLLRYDHTAPGMVLGAGATIVYNTAAGAVGTSANNGFNIYEKGTWTPTLTGGSTAGTTTYTTQEGFYTRWTQNFNVKFTVVITAATGTGSATLGALPFTVSSTAASNLGVARLSSSTWSFASTRTMVVWISNSNTTTGNLNSAADGLVSTDVNMNNSAATFDGSWTIQI